MSKSNLTGNLGVVSQDVYTEMKSCKVEKPTFISYLDLSNNPLVSYLISWLINFF